MTVSSRILSILAFAALIFVGPTHGGGQFARAQVNPTGPTVMVDFASPVTGLRSMSGFLHSVSATVPPDSMIAPLQPKLWRAANRQGSSPSAEAAWTVLYNRLVRHGARVQLLLSDTWGYSPRRPLPYENWADWESHVRQVAITNRGRNVIYDVWNEPDQTQFWEGVQFWRGTRDQFFETYLRTYKVLRQVLGPDVMIGGPSISGGYDKDFITAFLNYCRTNGCEVNFLSWHELNDRAPLPAIAEHLADARKVFLQNPEYASLRIQEIQINEIIGPIAKHLPGAILGYFYYLEKGRADGACKACWPNSRGILECRDTLDGLVTPETFQPRTAWWAYKTYADGVSSRVASTTTDARVVALASTRSAAPQTAQVLVAYFDRTYGTGRPVSVSVRLILHNLDRLEFLSGSTRVRLKLERMPDWGETPLFELILVDEQDLIIDRDSAQTIIENFAMGEAYRVTLSRP